MANKSGKPSGKPDAAKMYQFAIAMGMSPEDAQAFVQQQMAHTASDPNDPEVFWQATPNPGGPYYDARGPHRKENEYPLPPKLPETMKASAANYWLQQQFAEQTPAWTRVVKEMEDAGLISPGADLATILGQWEKAVALSAASTPHGAKLSPEDYIVLQGRLNQGHGGTHTVVSTSIDRTPRADMIGNAQTQAETDLGRRLTPAEAAARADSLSALESKNPRTTTTTSVTDALNNVRSSSSVTQGGIGAAGMQEQLTQQDMAARDYGAYQAAGRYFPVMMNAIAAINQAGT